MSLHLWISRLAGTGDYVIARDRDDAAHILMETVDDEELVCDPRRTWEQWPDEQPVDVVFMDEPGQPRETRTGRQMGLYYGRGYWGGWA